MDRADLEAVRIIVSHENCADGTAAAMLLHDALPHAELVFSDYGSAVDLQPRTGMLFCDFSPPAARADEYVALRAIVLDHHRSARAVVERFGDRGVFADETLDPGVSGAVLAYRHVWRVLGGSADPQFAEWFAAIAGVRDTWQSTDPRWHDGCVQHAVLMAFRQMFWVRQSFAAVAAEWHDRYAWVGDELIARFEVRIEQALAEATRLTTPSGVRVVINPGHSLVSDLTDRVGGTADLVAAFGYGRERGQLVMRVSLRSQGRFDCAALAQRYGGGGHSNAAGFAVVLNSEDPQPYTLLERLLR